MYDGPFLPHTRRTWTTSTSDAWELDCDRFGSLLAGISTKFRNKGIEVGLLTLGLATFGFGAALLLAYPIN